METELPVNDVVAAVGYENNSYFYRKFRERYEMTPNEYRERYRGEQQIVCRKRGSKDPGQYKKAPAINRCFQRALEDSNSRPFGP